jgi:hypothetical protein
MTASAQMRPARTQRGGISKSKNRRTVDNSPAFTQTPAIDLIPFIRCGRSHSQTQDHFWVGDELLESVIIMLGRVSPSPDQFGTALCLCVLDHESHEKVEPQLTPLALRLRLVQ